MKEFFTKTKNFIVSHKIWTSVTAIVLVLALLIGIFYTPIIGFLTGKVKVSFETFGADKVSSIWIDKGDSVPEDNLKKLTKPNNSFIGWFSDEKCEVQYINAPITQHTTLYAGFVADQEIVENEPSEVYIGEVEKDFALIVESTEKLTNENLSKYITLEIDFAAEDKIDGIKLSVKEKSKGKYSVTANYAEAGGYSITLDLKTVHIDDTNEDMKSYNLSALTRVVQFSVRGKNHENVKVSENVKEVAEKKILASNDKVAQIANDANIKIGDIVELPYLEGTDRFKLTSEITLAEAKNNGITVTDTTTPSKFYKVELADIGEIYDELSVYKNESVVNEEYGVGDDVAADLADTMVNSEEMDTFTKLLLLGATKTDTYKQLSDETPKYQTLSASTNADMQVSAQTLGELDNDNEELTLTPLSSVPKIQWNVKNTEFTDAMSGRDDIDFVKLTVTIKRSAISKSPAKGEILAEAKVVLEFYLHIRTESWSQKNRSNAKYDMGIVSATHTKLSFDVTVSTQKNGKKAKITQDVRKLMSNLEGTEMQELLDLYNDLVPSKESTRVELYRTTLLKPFVVVGILEISFPVSFVISMDFRAALSADFSVMTLTKNGIKGDTKKDEMMIYYQRSPSVTTYALYVQGKMDTRAGIELAAQLSFVKLSRLGNVKLAAQVGAYLEIYGMGYITKEHDASSFTGYSYDKNGAFHTEVGIYLNVNVTATVLKYSKRADLWDKEFPIMSYGNEKAVLGFAEQQHEPIKFSNGGFYLQDIPGILDTYVFDLAATSPEKRLTRADISLIMRDENHKDYIKGWGHFSNSDLTVTFDNSNFQFNPHTGWVYCIDSIYTTADKATMTLHYTGNSMKPNESITKTIELYLWKEDVLGDFDESKVGEKCTLTYMYNDKVVKTKEYNYGTRLNNTTLKNYTTYDQKTGKYDWVIEIPTDVVGFGVNSLEYAFPETTYILEDMVINPSKVVKRKGPVRVYYLDDTGTERTEVLYSPYGEVPDLKKYEEQSPDSMAFVSWDKPMEASYFEFFSPYPWDQWHLHAKYLPQHTAIVTFDTDGGILKNVYDETIESKTITAGWIKETMDGYQLVFKATKEGYNFKGWEYNGKVYEHYDIVPLTPGSEVTLKAVYEKMPVEITYDNNGTKTTEYYNVGDTVYVPTRKATKNYLSDINDGNNLVGWTSKNTGETHNFSFVATKSDTLTAVYAKETYFVMFDSMDGIFTDGSNYRVMQVPHGEVCNMTDVPVIDKYDGKTYKFSSWTPDISKPITKDTTFKALYTEETAKHTVTFDLNGGKMPSNAKLPSGAKLSADGSKITVSVTEGAYAPDIESPILVKGDGKNYGFVEWTPGFEPITKDTTYKAVFEEIESVGSENVDNPIDPEDVVGVHHKFENGVLTIYGTGKISNYLVDSEGQNVRPWDSNYDKITKIIIEKGITYIGNHAFSYLPNLTTVEMADSVTSAGFACFMDCGKLTNVKLSKGIKCNQSTYDKTDGNDFASMFTGCTSLKTITLPSGFERVPFQMFHSCESLQKINLPNNLKLIEWGAFTNCTSLKKVVLPASVQTIEMSAFSGCTALKSINTNDNMDIAEDAFDGCTSLKR